LTVTEPILQICTILAARGYTIEFATLLGREKLVNAYQFVSKVHTIGRAITEEEDEQAYLLFSKFDGETFHGRSDAIKFKKLFDSFWTDTYKRLKECVDESRPDFIFADYQVEAAKDVAREFCIPFAVLWPQIPWFMVPQRWIPGVTGAQTRCISAENASMYDRLYESMFILRWFPHLLDLGLWTITMRRRAGVKSIPFFHKKPDHLVFVNYFFGIELARDLPPLIQAVGPILADEYPPLGFEEQEFLKQRRKVAYVAFGTHMILSAPQIEKLLRGLQMSMSAGQIDGVIWSIKKTSRKQLDLEKSLSNEGFVDTTWTDLLANKNPSWLFAYWAAQRAILEHQSTAIFVTHAGPSSANEGIFHGTPMLTIPIGGDQIQEALRLEAAGVARRLKKTNFSENDVFDAVTIILKDENEKYRRNSGRLQGIAATASRRKHFAADLIEEHLHDWIYRFELDPKDETRAETSNRNGGRGMELSPMHLQTADARMTWIRLNSLDLLVAVAVACSIAVIVARSVLNSLESLSFM
jgi:UDP:flavonoid glycosyltransferase YjiC (YdhE family)